MIKLNKFITDEGKQLNLFTNQMILTYTTQKNESIDFISDVKRIKQKLDAYHVTKDVKYHYDIRTFDILGKRTKKQCTSQK